MTDTAVGIPDGASRRQTANKGRTRTGHVEELIVTAVPYCVLLILIVWLGVLRPGTLRIGQFHAILNLTLPLLFIAIGQTIVVLTGGLDLSVGGVLSLVSVVTALTMTDPSRVWIVSLLLLLFSIMPGLINGFLVVYGHIQPFVATLATWFIFGGLALMLMPSPGGVIDNSLTALSNGNVFGIPVSIIIFIIVVAFGVWFHRTRLGLEIQSIGSDRQAAYEAGIHVKRIEIIAYILCSFFTVLGGIVLAAQSLSGDPRVGDGFILPSFAAVAIGGARLSGGWGSVTGSIVGALALSYLLSVTYALGLPSQWALIFQALLLVLSVSFQYVVHLIFRGREGR